jgi:calcineurin-like phosphoesterase family protein
LIRTGGLVADGLINGSFDFICQLGDATDSGGKPEDWHWLMESFSRFGANTPTMAVIGNHDWSGISGSTNWGQIFSYPYAGDGISKYYSFDYLNAHFVMIDNFEAFYTISDTQLKWIQNDIQNAHKRGQQWVFAMFHLSMLTMSTSGWYSELQAQLMPIFDKEAVDGVFFAHDHDYQHYNFTYGDNGLLFDSEHNWAHHPVQYFCTGGGGADLEVDYGVLTKGSSTYSVNWYNTSLKDYQTINYIENSWNSSRFVSHDDFYVNYSQYLDSGIHNNKYYYYYPEYEDYSELAGVMGFDYGEQAYHFIQIEINGKTCKISATYPNGVVLSGPGGINPQQWILSK